MRPNFQPQGRSQDQETWRNFQRVRTEVSSVSETVDAQAARIAALEAEVAALRETPAGESGDTLLVGESALATSTYTGVSEVNFGTGTFNDWAEVTVSAPWVSAGSIIDAWIPGTATTSTHNAYEHLIAPIVVKVSEIDAGVSFTITAYSEHMLTGKFIIHWRGI